MILDFVQTQYHSKCVYKATATTTTTTKFICKNYNKCNFDNTHNKQALTYILDKSKFLAKENK